MANKIKEITMVTYCPIIIVPAIISFVASAIFNMGIQTVCQFTAHFLE